MTASATSPRRGRPVWADVRFLLGIALVLVSVAGVWLVVGAARQTTQILVASRTLVPGHEIGIGDLRVVDVALGAAAGAYLPASSAATGRVVTRTVAAGELVPTDALAEVSDAAATRVVVRSDIDIPASVVGGSRVELWASRPAERGATPTAPRILVADAVVASVSEAGGALGDDAHRVELVVPHASAADVLAALSDGSALSVLPLTGGAR